MCRWVAAGAMSCVPYRDLQLPFSTATAMANMVAKRNPMEAPETAETHCGLASPIAPRRVESFTSESWNQKE